MRDLVIIGCGGFGREVLDVAEAANEDSPQWNVLGFLDDSPSESDQDRVRRRGLDVLGGLSFLTDRPNVSFVIGIGPGSVRRTIDEAAVAAGLSPSTLIHPAATLGADVHVGGGTVICAGVRVTTNVHLGRHVHLNLNSTVGHDTRIADFVTVNPLVAVSGGAEIGQGSTLGTNSSILQELRVAPGTFVGAGACVTRDIVEPGTLVVGTPAKPIRK